MDHHSEEFPLVNQKISETPIQTSLLLRMGNSKVTPFLLGGPGWYRRKVSLLEGSADADLTTTEFGWHAGVGLEVFAGRHFGIHGDYRYTFLDFNGDDKRSGGSSAACSRATGDRCGRWGPASTSRNYRPELGIGFTRARQCRRSA